jgi:hypothetical protein
MRVHWVAVPEAMRARRANRRRRRRRGRGAGTLPAGRRLHGGGVPGGALPTARSDGCVGAPRRHLIIAGLTIVLWPVAAASAYDDDSVAGGGGGLRVPSAYLSISPTSTAGGPLAWLSSVHVVVVVRRRCSQRQRCDCMSGWDGDVRWLAEEARWSGPCEGSWLSAERLRALLLNVLLAATALSGLAFGLRRWRRRQLDARVAPGIS